MVRSITSPPRGHVSRPVAHITAQIEIVRAQAASAFWANPSAPEAEVLSSLSSALMGLLQVVEESREPGRELRVGGSDGGAGIRVFSAPTTRPAVPVPAVALSFGGVAIRDRDQQVSLTDMWKAAGSVENRRPACWLRHDSTAQFVEHIAATLNVSQEHIDKNTGKPGLVVSERGGRNPGTWAHWQVAMAYAKYLSPEFHAWCNSVVREHMEARGARRLP